MQNNGGNTPKGGDDTLHIQPIFRVDISDIIQNYFSPYVTRLLGDFFSDTRELFQSQDSERRKELVLKISQGSMNLKEAISQGEYENDEIKSLMAQIEHVISPVAILHSLVGLEGLEELVRKRIEDEINDEIRAIQYAYDSIGMNIENLQRLSNDTLYIGQEEAISEVRKIIKETDVRLEVYGNTQSKVHAAHFSVILQNLISNYDKYGEQGELYITFGQQGFTIRFINKKKSKDKVAHKHSGGKGFQIFDSIVNTLGGNINREEDEQYFSISLSRLQYQKEA